MTWVFEEFGKMGGSTGTAFTSSFTATGMNPGGKLAREAIQNSVDAALSDNSKVTVNFQRVELTGTSKTHFVELLGLPYEPKDRAQLSGINWEEQFNYEDDQGHPLALLYVDDFGTTGLDGDPHFDESNFFRFLFSMGDDSKKEEKRSTGGSYGFGKAVYPSSSRIKTIVAFTLTKDDEHRLFGCSFFPKHKLNGISYTGRGWFGVEDPNEKGLVHPFIDDDAVELGRKLGFQERVPGRDYGTSVLIVDCAIGIDELRQSVETWWWPRLLEDMLDVNLYSNGEMQTPARPKKRTDLEPFIQSFNLIQNDHEVSSDFQKVVPFNRLKNLRLGTLGLTMLDTGSESAPETKPSGAKVNEEDSTMNSVALIRSQRMVVAYHQVLVNREPYKGVFIAHSDVDDLLKRSEPQQHNLWDPQSERLDASLDEASVVKAILSRIGSNVSTFLNDASPPPPTNHMKLTQLEKLLGASLRPRPQKGKPNIGNGKQDPISIQFYESPKVDVIGTDLFVSGGVALRLAEAAEVDAVEAVVDLSITAVEDGAGKAPHYIGAQVEVDGQEARLERDRYVNLRISKLEERRISFTSFAYPADWTVDVKVLVSGGIS